MLKNRIIPAIALTALIGVAACERREETRIETTPATTESPAVAPAPTTTDPAHTGPMTTDPAHTGTPGMYGDTLRRDTL
jgi:hypothetical protein